MIDDNMFGDAVVGPAALLEAARAAGKFKMTTNLEYNGVATEFKGYETTRVHDSKVLALIKADAEVQSLKEGDEGEVVLDKTPFYAESGGQVGDTGRISGDGVAATVVETSKHHGVFGHKVKVVFKPSEGGGRLPCFTPV